MVVRAVIVQPLGVQYVEASTTPSAVGDFTHLCRGRLGN